MTKVLTAAQMRALEAQAMAAGAVTGLALMERAGVGVVAAICDAWPDMAAQPRRAVVLCGPGNNGGDGFVVARLLAARGWDVSVFFYGDAARLPPDARTNYDRLGPDIKVQPLGFPVADTAAQDAFCAAASHQAAELEQDDGTAKSPFVVIDALFGLGLSRPIRGLNTVMTHMDYLALHRDLNSTHLVAIDVPSGYDTDTGAPIWDKGPDANPFPCIAADLVVTFHAPKPVHKTLMAQGTTVVVADIGL